MSNKQGGFMYGIVNKVVEDLVEFIYEPPQQGSEASNINAYLIV